MINNANQFMPNDLRNYFNLLFRKLFGIFLLSIGIFLLLSFLSLTITDNSLYTVSTFATSNMGGSIGANIAQFLMQVFGLSSTIIIIQFFIFGIHFLKKEFMKYPQKEIILFAIISIFLTSLNLAYIGNIFNSSMGWGGIIGHTIKLDISNILSKLYITQYMQLIIFMLTLTLNIFTLYFALNLNQNNIIKIKSIILKLYNKIKIKVNKKVLTPTVKKSTQTKQPTHIVKKTVEIKPTPKPQSSASGYKLPLIEFLNPARNDKTISTNDEVNIKKARMLENILAEFGVEGSITNIKTGPVITLFEMEPGRGIKTSRITNLSEDIARDMSALSARVAVIAGTNKIGIELPNTYRKTVYIREQFESDEFITSDHILPISLGHDTSGKPVFVDLAKMPHLLIAGTTGSGKSVGVNGMILSLLYKYTPDEVKFIMIDPKMLEFSVYNDIPHLLIPVVIDPIKAVAALKWAVREMEDRNRNMSALGAKNIESYNTKAQTMSGKFITREVQTGFDPTTGEPIMEDRKIEIKPIPYIVVIVDEMADLMLVAGKEVEAAIARLAAMARAAGIHLILSTQRPSVDVITGTIKSNFPNRISYRVASKIDSRTIINEQGAELMLGKGDMLYMAMGGNLIRIHGAFVSENEIEKAVTHIKAQAKPNYVKNITAEKPDPTGGLSLLDKTIFKDTNKDKDEDLYNQAVQIILSSDRPSISYLQRQLGIGYNKSANLIEKMQANGILSAPDSTGKRTILSKRNN